MGVEVAYLGSLASLLVHLSRQQLIARSEVHPHVPLGQSLGIGVAHVAFGSVGLLEEVRNSSVNEVGQSLAYMNMVLPVYKVQEQPAVVEDIMSVFSHLCLF